jgi:hypothetical protein
MRVADRDFRLQGRFLCQRQPGDLSPASIRSEQTAGPAIEAKAFEQKDFVGAERVRGRHLPTGKRGWRLRKSRD